MRSSSTGRKLDGEDSTSFPSSKSPTSEESPPNSPAKKCARQNTCTKKDSSTQTEVIVADIERPSYLDDDEFADSSSIMLLSEYDFDERWKEFFAKQFTSTDAVLPVRQTPSAFAAPFSNGDIGRTSVVIISTESMPFFRRLLQYLSPSCFRNFRASVVGSYRLQINKEPLVKRKKTRLKTHREKSNRQKSSVDIKSEGERRKKRIQKLKERRATLVVTLVIATFVACWMPFFVSSVFETILKKLILFLFCKSLFTIIITITDASYEIKKHLRLFQQITFNSSVFLAGHITPTSDLWKSQLSYTSNDIFRRILAGLLQQRTEPANLHSLPT